MKNNLHILIVDDNNDDVELCERALRKCTAMSYTLHRAASGASCMEKLEQKRPDCLLLDYSLPGNDGLHLLQNIRAIHPYLPVIVLTGQGNESLAALFIKSGAQDYLVKSAITTEALHQAITSAIHQCDESHVGIKTVMDSPLILIVDDNPDDRENYIRSLRKNGACNYRYVELESGLSIRQSLGKLMPDCVLLDYSLPGMNGLEILRQILPEYPFLPVIMMTGQGNESVAVQAIKEGAQHYLVKSEITPEILHMNIKTAIKHCTLERDRSDLVRKLTESNTELERFAYVASHDLQEPARMIVSFSRILMKEYSDTLDREGTEYLTLIADAGNRMRDMVEDLLAYSRLSNEGKAHTSFDGNNVLEAALENLQELLLSKNAVTTHDVFPSLFGNPVQIMRVLQNLIANAVKYQPAGNIPRIHIGIQDTGEAWEISVQDNGLGIDKKYIDQIFQPFHRLHVWQSIQGTGLGLSICKKIIETHDGNIQVTSDPGKGSVFSFSLPKNIPHHEAEAA